MTSVGTKNSTVARVMQALQQKSETNSAQLERINANIVRVSPATDTVVDELEHGTDPEAKLDPGLKRIEKMEDDVEKQCQTDLADLKKQEQEDKAAWERWKRPWLAAAPL
ncbi:hypothetical protein Tdes44962_MAKER01230 [Teratosphaeria destructans]|uniref:Uncharacterized protein n=1 Tax=Teratosphaeria destructans TaxID=418781 RepID=A0A9W7T0H4_9PEZI|nr:hypothetical protein Tdes44962_MAKER01230 [Teratosphaeria destructans]